MGTGPPGGEGGGKESSSAIAPGASLELFPLEQPTTATAANRSETHRARNMDASVDTTAVYGL